MDYNAPISTSHTKETIETYCSNSNIIREISTQSQTIKKIYVDNQEYSRNIVYRKMTSYNCIGLMNTGTLQETRKLINPARWRISSKINTIYAGHVNPSWIEARVE